MPAILALQEDPVGVHARRRFKDFQCRRHVVDLRLRPLEAQPETLTWLVDGVSGIVFSEALAVEVFGKPTAGECE